MHRTSISLDNITVEKLDRIQNAYGCTNRSATITTMINNYESAMMQLEVLQEYFRVTRGMVNPKNKLIKEKDEDSIGDVEEIVSQPKNPPKHFDRFKNSHDNMPD